MRYLFFIVLKNESFLHMHKIIARSACLIIAVIYLFISPVLALSEEVEKNAPEGQVEEYVIGVNDVLSISILQPDAFMTEVVVSPDGSIAFPYIGTVRIKGLTLTQIKEKIQTRLADGYMKYPVVLVSLLQSRSKKFFVYGEVVRPGTYPIEENTTTLRAISMAGGFTRFGSSSRVKILRQRDGSPGYEVIKIKIKDMMNGDAVADILLQNGDIMVVSEGVF